MPGCTLCFQMPLHPEALYERIVPLLPPAANIRRMLPAHGVLSVKQLSKSLLSVPPPTISPLKNSRQEGIHRMVCIDSLNFSCKSVDSLQNNVNQWCKAHLDVESPGCSCAASHPGHKILISSSSEGKNSSEVPSLPRD